MTRTVEVPLTDDQRDIVAKSGGLVGLARRRWPYLVRAIGDRDEAESLANLALCRAAQRHDPARGCYATVAMLTIWSLWMESAGGGSDLIRVKDVTRLGRLRQSLTSLDALLAMGPDERHEAERAISVADAASGLDPFEIETLTAALDLLDERKRSAIRLRHLDGLKFPEVGKRLGVTKERARQLVIHAEAALRAWLRLDDCGLHYLGRKRA